MNEVKEFKTVKLYKKTADRVKRHCKKNGLTMAAWLSNVISAAIIKERRYNKKGD